MAKYSPEHFAANMKHWRLVRGYSQPKLAEALDVSRVTISRLENGHRTPNLERLTQLAELLRVSPNQLLTAPADDPSTLMAVFGKAGR
jgi:transcriptional regulator with XRE-family HTH domain